LVGGFKLLFIRLSQCGSNDIEAGKSPDFIFDNFKELLVFQAVLSRSTGQKHFTTGGYAAD
jgi:hypothetical protein